MKGGLGLETLRSKACENYMLVRMRQIRWGSSGVGETPPAPLQAREKEGGVKGGGIEEGVYKIWELGSSYTAKSHS